MRTILLLIINLYLLFFPTIPVAAPLMVWFGQEQNRPIAELKLMTEKELCSVSNSVCDKAIKDRERKDQMCSYFGFSHSECIESLLGNRDIRSEGEDYCETILRVIRARKGGHVPKWAEDTRKAFIHNNPDECADIGECVDSDKKNKKTRKAK
jgi:hypothetical protein